MSYVRKNIFGFATIAATVTLSAAIFATGCGDSGDSTAVNPLNPDKIANAITVNYGKTTEAVLRSNKVESLRWLITDTKSGQQFASRDTVQKINYTGTTTKANAALAEENTTSDGTTADKTPTSATKNDKCYVVLGLPSTVFQKMTNVTVTAIYYDKDGHVVGFGSDDIKDDAWNTDKSGKKISGTITDGNFFSEKDAQYSLTASPEFIKKYDEELAKKDPNATQADAFTTLAYNVTDGTTTANIIGLVDIDNYKDIKDYIQPEEVKVGEYPTPGRYKGVAYTTAYGAEVEVKLDRASVSGYTQNTKVYVTDRTPSKLDVTVTPTYQKTVLVPENVKEQGQTKTADYALGQTKATSSESKWISYGVRQLPLEVYVSDWGEGKSAKPNAYPKVDTSKVTFAVKDSAQKAFKAEDVAVENGVVKFKQSKLDAPVAFTVEAAYGQATGKLEGAKAVPATVEVGFGQEAKATDGTTSIAKDFTTIVEGDSNKDVTASLKMYARFVADDQVSLSLFEIPSTAGFTYPSTAALFDADNKIYNAKDATVTIATADQQKANDYSVTIKKDNQKNNLNVKFVEKDTIPYTEQIKAFGAFTKLNIQNLLDLVIAPETQVDPTPSPTPGGNPDPDAGDQP